jgi:transcriptional regulator with XRE-family HTH domain
MASVLEPALSPSVQLILDRLDRLKLSKTEFARMLGVSPDYVYRILKGRVPFPYVRETIERMAEICQVDPGAFPEYREMEQMLSASTRLVWQRMKERKMSREDLFQALGGRMSRPYFNSILRGDQPFPSNRAFVQLFALALGLEPAEFKEYHRPTGDRWKAEDIHDLEVRLFNLLFDKMLAERGFASQAIALVVFDDQVLRPFPDRYPSELEEVLQRMGELEMGLVELEKVSSVPGADLRRLFGAKEPMCAFGHEIRDVRRALRLD